MFSIHYPSILTITVKDYYEIVEDGTDGVEDEY